MSYVYVFDFGDMVKVGYSAHPLQRLYEVQRGNSLKAVRTLAVNVGDFAITVEREAHSRLSQYLVQGNEYFRCSFAVARNTVLDTAAEILGHPVRSFKVGGVVSSAQREATARYNKKAYDRIEIKVKKGWKAKIFAYAASKNKSVNQFIVELIDKAMNDYHEGDASQ